MNTAPVQLPDTVRAEPGPGGLAQLLVHNAFARARLSLQGAQLLSFQPHGQADWLFLSPRARFEAGQAIRGGVPICWPWFGPDPEDLGRPAHGFARQRTWTLHEAATEPDGSTRLSLLLRDDEATRTLWPHRFELLLDMHIGRSLRLSLQTHNNGHAPFAFSEALHSYFAVPHIDAVQVLGLENSPYTDKVPGAPAQGAATGAPLRFAGRLDRIYAKVPAQLRLQGAAPEHSLLLRSEGSAHAVLWNPGAELAAAMPDLGPGAHQHFACVETANVGEQAIELAPGERHRLSLDVIAPTH